MASDGKGSRVMGATTTTAVYEQQPLQLQAESTIGPFFFFLFFFLN